MKKPKNRYAENFKGFNPAPVAPVAVLPLDKASIEQMRAQVAKAK